jgi:hypothetical protein
MPFTVTAAGDMYRFRIGQLLTGIDCIKYTEGGNMENRQTHPSCSADIQAVAPQDLVDISNIEIDTTLDKKRRIQNFIRDIKNPYCFRCNNTIVKVSFCSEGSSFQELLQNYFCSL